MGVRDLRKFIETNDATGTVTVLQECFLFDTKLIIDGNSFCHFLFRHTHTKLQPDLYQFGGEYHLFADSCEFFFRALSRCNVQAFVVLDGAHPPDDSKGETLKVRAKSRLTALQQGKAVLPIMIQDQFCNVLDSLHIPHVTCSFEADPIIASLAKRMDCPVASQDNDFFIYNIPAGVFPLSYFQMSDLASSTSQISCKIFDQQAFREFVLGERSTSQESQSFMALFATLVGSDFIQKEDMEDFYDYLRNTYKEEQPAEYVRINNIICWLQGMETVEKATKTVISKTKLKNVAQLISRSMHYYTDLNSNKPESRRICAYFTSTDEQVPLLDVQTKDGKVLPDMVGKLFSTTKLPPVMLDILVNRRIFLPCQLEDMGELTSYNCSKSLRQIMYGVLLSIDDDSLSSRDIYVEEWTRDGYNLKMENVAPSWRVGDRPVLRLRCVHQTRNEIKNKFLMEALAIRACDISFVSSDVDSFSWPVQFLIRVIQHWIVHSSHRSVNKQHVQAVLLTMMKLDAFKSLPDLPDMSKLEGIFSDERSDISAAHAFAQFQACFQTARDLSLLLCLTETVPEPKVVFSGRMTCGLFRMLTDNPGCCQEFLVDRLVEAVTKKKKKKKKKQFHSMRT